METDTTTWSEFPNGGRAIAAKILESKDKSIQMSRTSFQDPSKKVNHLNKVIKEKSVILSVPP